MNPHYLRNVMYNINLDTLLLDNNHDPKFNPLDPIGFGLLLYYVVWIKGFGDCPGQKHFVASMLMVYSKGHQ